MSDDPGIQCDFRCTAEYNAVSAPRQPMAEISAAQDATVTSYGLDGKLAERPATPGMKLYEGDVIKAAPGGSITYKAGDHTLMTSGSQPVTINKQTTLAGEQGSRVADVGKGILRFVGGQIAPKEPPKVTSPSGTIGIRG